jgi:hypothetical protein
MHAGILGRMRSTLLSTLSSVSLLSLAAAGVACTDDTTPDDEIGDATDGSTSGDGDGDTNTETGSSDSSSDDATDTSSDDATTETTETTDDTDTGTSTTDTGTDTTDTGTDTTETGDPCGPECCPGETMCEGEVSLICNDDGTAWEEDEICDGIQGLVCNDQGICEGACTEDALGLSYIGCDYYPTVTLQYDIYNQAPHVFAVAVANVFDEDAMITITQGNAMIADTVVAPGDVEVITLPWVNALTKGNGPTAITVDGAYRLRSDRPIVVYQFNPLAATTTNDASLLLPVNAWGPDYLVASWPHWTSIPAFYAVVAHEDDTTVTLNPGPNVVSVSAGAGVGADGSGVVVLDNSDVLQVVTSSGDLTGALINADKPISVFGGHKCTNVPANITACDHLEEALFPIQTLADEYVVVPPIQVPNNNLLKAQMVRIISTEDDTDITFEPDLGMNQNLAQAGQFIQLDMSTAQFKVTGSKKIMVVQYMVGQSAGFGTSDPSMVQAVTPAQFRNDYLFHAAPNWTANFVDIIAPNGATVTVDGANVANWTAIGATGFSAAHVPLSNAGNGNHTVDSNQKVGISVYGVQNAGSYWYPGGLDLEIDPQ